MATTGNPKLDSLLEKELDRETFLKIRAIIKKNMNLKDSRAVVDYALKNGDKIMELAKEIRVEEQIEFDKKEAEERKKYEEQLARDKGY